jgi:hypothetical protein
MSIQSTREGLLVVDLIDTKNKDLAWRLYGAEKIINVDKGWKKADEDFTKGFESYPPSAKQIEDKKKERANEKPKPEQMQQESRGSNSATSGFRGWRDVSGVNYFSGFALR